MVLTNNELNIIKALYKINKTQTKKIQSLRNTLKQTAPLKDYEFLQQELSECREKLKAYKMFVNEVDLFKVKSKKEDLEIHHKDILINHSMFRKMLKNLHIRCNK